MSDPPKDTRSQEAKREEEKPSPIDPKRIFSSMFFGWRPPPEQQQPNEDSSEAVTDRDISTRPNWVRPEWMKSSNDKSSKSGGSTDDDEQEESRPIAARIADYIPKDPTALRQSSFYKTTYRSIQWQRDNYLVGREYANWRKAERKKRPDDETTNDLEIPYDASALSHEQIARLASNFIPSDTVRNAALPLVVDLPKNVAIYRMTKNAMVDLILSQQPNLDTVLKNQLVMFLTNPQNRINIKNSTQGYIETKYRDSNVQDNKGS